MKRKDSHRIYTIAALLGYGVVLLLTVFLSPPFSFYTGDQGLKLIQVRTVVEHGPLHFSLPEKAVPNFRR